ncbi:mannitol dehydrogenase family protein [Marinobacterium rhizophilum]|uniref:Mannitol dehydrogenase family protein n=1 Tax=Marinobacterium rhizophilum TaxID=420402 RepID=A0ABY5HEH3_9GAMM|nr:mannitol dehydrogenase family protein [Marinobacterium rhizophilum]UTW10241.1 mannitol dehydrogenase family protein [Marinobacterium rhizophilum]
MKLNTENLSQLPASVVRPSYDRCQVKQGIVHIGVGGFHRAHQALYTEMLLNQGYALDWGICGVGLRSEDRAMKSALASQDYLYTLYELGDTNDTQIQVVGAIGDFLLAEDSPEALIAKLANPTTRIVSLTITEGGYCTDDSTGEFLAELPEIRHDLEQPQAPKTVFGFLTAALKLRRDAGLTPFTLMSCDNLPHNGQIARKALLGFAALQDMQLHDWIAENVSFPNAMVDRITPMTSDAHRRQLRDETGIEDAWPVVAEPYIQWVIEDKFANGRPEWEVVGVQFTDNVTPYEEMKIGLLNGAHQALAYLGALLGHSFTHETMQDRQLRKFVRAYMDKDVTPLLAEVPGIDLDAYKDSLIERFSNTAICDQVSRICYDASSRLPKFVLPTLLKQIEAGRPLHRTALIAAAWCHYQQGVDEKGNAFEVEDPRLERVQQAARCGDGQVERFLALDEVFGRKVPESKAFVAAFRLQLGRLQTLGVRRTLELTMEGEG